MANLPSVGVTDGVPDSGTGTVSTLDGAFNTAAGPVGTPSNPLSVSTGGVPFVGSAVGADTGGSIVVPAVAGKTFYLTHVGATGTGATAASCPAISVDNLLNSPAGTVYWLFSIPAGVNNAVNFTRDFTYPWPAKAADTALTFNIPPFGAGNTLQCVDVVGYYA